MIIVTSRRRSLRLLTVVAVGLVVVATVPRSCALDFGGYLRKAAAAMMQTDEAATAATTNDNNVGPQPYHPLRDAQRRSLRQQQLQQQHLLQQTAPIDQSRRREELSKDRETLIDILTSAGATSLTLDDIRNLPTWTQVSSLYGSDPIIYGLDTCQAYRERLQYYNATSSVTVEPKPRVGGLFNTGTNAVSQSMSANFKPVPNVKEYNLKWGKHVPPRPQWLENYDIEGIETALPIILIRDPMYWMQSMCKAEYNAVWDKGLGNRCPNLIPTEQERRDMDLGNATTFPVDVIVRTQYRDHYESLAGLWSDWNRLWLEYSRPRLMIRFEDFLFHGEMIMQTISECAGIRMHQDFSYQLEASKSHGHSSDLYGAIVKYGSGQGRVYNYTSAEKEYLETALDPELMQLFRYKPINEAEQFAGI